jgi:hypothetical protein
MSSLTNNDEYTHTHLTTAFKTRQDIERCYNHVKQIVMYEIGSLNHEANTFPNFHLRSLHEKASHYASNKH